MTRKTTVDGVTIEPCNNVKYLGVNINSELNFAEHVEYVYKKTLSLSHYGTPIFKSYNPTMKSPIV